MSKYETLRSFIDASSPAERTFTQAELRAAAEACGFSTVPDSLTPAGHLRVSVGRLDSGNIYHITFKPEGTKLVWTDRVEAKKSGGYAVSLTAYLTHQSVYDPSKLWKALLTALVGPGGKLSVELDPPEEVVSIPFETADDWSNPVVYVESSDEEWPVYLLSEAHCLVDRHVANARASARDWKMAHPLQRQKSG